MTSGESRSSAMWVWLHVAIILSTSAIVLYPPVRQFGAFMVPFGFVLMPVYFFLLLRRMKADATGKVPLSELHTQVQAGRRLPNSTLEWAAATALLLSTIYLSAGRG
jgi:hypothetical protein